MGKKNVYPGSMSNDLFPGEKSLGTRKHFKEHIATGKIDIFSLIEQVVPNFHFLNHEEQVELLNVICVVDDQIVSVGRQEANSSSIEANLEEETDDGKLLVEDMDMLIPRDTILPHWIISNSSEFKGIDVSSLGVHKSKRGIKKLPFHREGLSIIPQKSPLVVMKNGYVETYKVLYNLGKLGFQFVARELIEKDPNQSYKLEERRMPSPDYIPRYNQKD